MPLPSEHAARLRDPGDFDHIVQLWNKESEGIRGLGGPLKSDPSGPTEEESIRFKADKWTPAEAKKWLKDNKKKWIRFEEATGEEASHPYLIRCQAADEAEIWIYDVIGESLFGEGTTAKKFVEDMKALKAVRKIVLHINSPGGNPFDAIAIYNNLRQHRARKTVYVDGLAASAASVIAMAGDEINIAGNAMFMIHEAMTFAAGNAHDLRTAADSLESVNNSIMSTYMAHAKVDQQTVADLMAAESWLSADKAVEYGFADQITEPLEMAASFDLSKFKYKHPPEFLTAKAVTNKAEPSRPKAEEEAATFPAEAAKATPSVKAPTKVDLKNPTLYQKDLVEYLRKSEYLRG